MYRILVVDDEKTERECVRFLIAESGLALEVSEAGDGLEALEKLKETGGADILFTDVQMPRMDGLELIRQAEKLFPEMKLLIFSSYADFEYARTALTLGVVNYILKPVVPEDLKSSLEGLIGQLDEEAASRRERDERRTFLLQYALQLSISGNFDHAKAEPAVLDQLKRFRTMVLVDFDGDFLENNSFVFYESLRCVLKLDMESLNLSPNQALLMLRTPGGGPAGAGRTDVFPYPGDVPDPLLAVLQPSACGVFFPQGRLRGGGAADGTAVLGPAGACVYGGNAGGREGGRGWRNG